MRPEFDFTEPTLPHAWHHAVHLPDWAPPLALAVVALLYALPTAIAVRRKHHNRVAIALLNLFLGWTFIGWVLALVWAATAVRRLCDPGEPPQIRP